ncbi:MAG: VIT family protein [Nitrospirae bacterium]|nr:MAG: VIT family protein [Nitrospirota bacterium]
MSSHRPERHYTGRIGWLRAAVLGANDGIISMASFLVGITAADVSYDTLFLAGMAGLVAGAMSMAAGEYISVSSQADTIRADLQRERRELLTDTEFEQAELTRIYIQRGVDPTLAAQVAQQLMAHDALAAHARDELGLTDTQQAHPVQAALASAAAFTVGGALPLTLLILSPPTSVLPVLAGSSLVFLAGLGGLAAWAGGANPWIGAARVTFWGALAMGLTASIGALVGPTV